MASLSLVHFLCLPRCQSNCPPCNALSMLPKFPKLPGFQLESRKWCVSARKKLVEGSGDEALRGDEGVLVKKKMEVVSATKRTRKKAVVAEEESVEGMVAGSGKEGKKAPGRPRKKAPADSSNAEEVKAEKKVRERRKSKLKEEGSEDLVPGSKVNETQESPFVVKVEEVNVEKKVRGRSKTKPKEGDSESLLSENEVSEVVKFEEVNVEKKVRGRSKTKPKEGDSEGLLSKNEVSEIEELPFVATVDEVKAEKKVRGRRKTKQKEEDGEDLASELEVSSTEEFPFVAKVREVKTEKKVRGKRKTEPKDAGNEDLVSENEMSEIEEWPIVANIEDEKEEELNIEEGDDISSTYGWPPLVCCFGAAQHAFVPSGRPANRLINYEIHERMKDAYWAPEKFVRAPGGSAGSVAIALASLGGKVAFMGKLGTDDFGEAMLYYMNVNSVQTRAVRIDASRMTAVSQMRISKTGRLRTTCVKPCAEDSLSKSEINIDVLKEAKMFYFSTHSLLDPNMRSTTLRAIRISKKLGAVIFYDVNLPMPLWQSSAEAKAFIHQVWNLADIIEVTKQELEFLCGITPLEEFDTKNNASSKFVHYSPEVVAPLWHENLKVMFVTNGTSKIHYYTKEHNGSVHGMEDPHLTPFTADMSASGDGIIAGILRLLTVQPELITDKGFLEHTIKYAIDCGIIDQWALGRVRGFPPNEEDKEEVTPDENGIRSITEREFRTLKPVS